MSLQRPLRVTLLVSGSIAAYKSAEVIRELKRLKVDVRVAMTRGAMQFITPLTLQTLSANPVGQELFSLEEEQKIGHIRLADEADVVLVCPASADLLAKARTGVGDSLVSAVLLATRAPVVCAPAMNVNMWNHPATRENVEVLRNRGWQFVDPESGELACGWIGEGRLAEVKEIVDAVLEVAGKKNGPLSGAHVVVTAGPTREFIDAVRFISNRSSGKMGYAIARQAALRGARVTLISGPSDIQPPAGVDLVRIQTAGEMEAAVGNALSFEDNERGPQILVKAAAVTDFRPTTTFPHKLKQSKADSQTLELAPNPDILAGIGARRASSAEQVRRRMFLVGFAVESGGEEMVLAYARRKLKDKQVDLIVANHVNEGFGGDVSRVWFVRSDSTVVEHAGLKHQLAGALLDEVEELMRVKGRAP